MKNKAKKVTRLLFYSVGLHTVTLTSPSGPGSRPRPKPRYSAGLLVAAADAGSQHRFHVLVLCSVLGVAQTLRLLALLAAAGSAAVAARAAIASALKGRGGTKENKNLATCILSSRALTQTSNL